MANRYWNLRTSKSKGTSKEGSDLDSLIELFKAKGDRMLTKLVDDKDYMNRTGNLVSSYAYAMFYNGEELYRKTSDDISTKPAHGIYKAKEEIDKVLKEKLSQADKDRFTFVIFAAMYYASILESKWAISMGRNRMVIKDIIREDMEVLANKTKGNLKSYG